MDLKQLRDGIDDVDSEILSLFMKRMKLCRGVADYKKEHNMPVFQGGREQQIIDRIVELTADKNLEKGTSALFTTIMDISKILQNRTILEENKDYNYTAPDFAGAKKIGCQGTSGANSEAAAKKVFGDREFTFYPTEAASRQAEQSRIAVLYSLAKENARIHVASVPGLLQRTIPPEVLLRAAFEIRSDSTCPPEDLEDALVRCGYSRAEQVDGPGQFARRGGILDFFSPFSSDPVRIEFWGDEIDSMSSFDVLTQRRTDPLESCTVLPAAEVLPTLSAGGVEVLAREMDAAASRLAKRRTSENAAALAANMRADAERLRNGVLLSDADRYLPVTARPLR